MADFIPGNEDGFYNWQTHFMEELDNAPAGWNVPAAAVTNLAGLQTPYLDAYAVANSGKKTTRTQQQVQAKRDAQKAYKAGIRQFVKEFLAFNSNITNSDRVALGLPERDNTRTPSTTPTVVPDLFHEPLTGARLKVSVKEAMNGKTNGKNGKPAGAGGYEIAYWAGDNAPATGDGCISRNRYNRSPATLQFNAADAGKKVTLFARWIGKKNQTGPWSASSADVIPM